MNLDDAFAALRRVMRDLGLPDKDASINIYPHPEYPQASVVYTCPASRITSVDLEGDDIPLYRTMEGRLRVTIQAEPEAAA